jgi:hypothetical protein
MLRPVKRSSRSGTPNSTTTTMSELSTVAIKDGHRGHHPYHHGQQHQASGLSARLDAERADRISRLAGLERVTTARSFHTPNNLTAAPVPPTQTYFDQSGNPAMLRERSTVGSASATGSIGHNTTWAGSEAGDGVSNFDKMSESQDMDMDTQSVGGMSDEGAASLVAFGEGARTPARQSVMSAGSGSVAGGGNTPRGFAYDSEAVDSAAEPLRTRSAGFGAAGGVAEQVGRIERANMDTTSADRMRRGQIFGNTSGSSSIEK